MNEKTVWLNAYSTPENYLSGIYGSRDDADELDAALVEEHGKEQWIRTACLQVRLCWEDGQGLEDLIVEVHAEGGEA